jgi:hypothetical protein
VTPAYYSSLTDSDEDILLKRTHKESLFEDKALSTLEKQYKTFEKQAGYYFPGVE